MRFSLIKSGSILHRRSRSGAYACEPSQSKTDWIKDQTIDATPTSRSERPAFRSAAATPTAPPPPAGEFTAPCPGCLRGLRTRPQSCCSLQKRPRKTSTIHCSYYSSSLSSASASHHCCWRGSVQLSLSLTARKSLGYINR